MIKICSLEFIIIIYRLFIIQIIVKILSQSSSQNTGKRLSKHGYFNPKDQKIIYMVI